MNCYVATTAQRTNYATPFAIHKDSIMAIINKFTYSKDCTHCVPQSYSLELTPIRLLPVWFLEKEKPVRILLHP
jgi:hypothetical protein